MKNEYPSIGIVGIITAYVVTSIWSANVAFVPQSTDFTNMAVYQDWLTTMLFVWAIIILTRWYRNYKEQKLDKRNKELADSLVSNFGAKWHSASSGMAKQEDDFLRSYIREHHPEHYARINLP